MRYSKDYSRQTELVASPRRHTTTTNGIFNPSIHGLIFIGYPPTSRNAAQVIMLALLIFSSFELAMDESSVSRTRMSVIEEDWEEE